MKFKKTHPIVLAMGNNLIPGDIHNMSGIIYEVIDNQFGVIELEIKNPIIKWKKQKR